MTLGSSGRGGAQPPEKDEALGGALPEGGARLEDVALSSAATTLGGARRTQAAQGGCWRGRDWGTRRGKVAAMRESDEVAAAQGSGEVVAAQGSGKGCRQFEGQRTGGEAAVSCMSRYRAVMQKKERIGTDCRCGGRERAILRVKQIKHFPF
jgi:hypothetical protein